MTETVKIAIIGGGLAGLATAAALGQHGFEVDIFEQAPALGEVGAGINISCQGVKALRAIGSGAGLEERANVGKGIYNRDLRTGEPLGLSDLRAQEEQYGAPWLTFHRADLLGGLAKSVDSSRLHLGRRLADLRQDSDGVTLNFADGGSHRAELVIGADGVRSTVRRAIYGEDSPTFTGQMAYRALIPPDSVPAETMGQTGHVQWMGPGRHVLLYYLRGREVLYIVTQADTEQWVEESWNSAGDPDAFRAQFSDAEPALRQVLSNVETCSQWGLFTRPIDDNWGDGRILLIGDAAHAMLPNAGQGANQSFEDAYILGRWLDAERRKPLDAFASFKRVRMPRVQAIQRLSTFNAKFKHIMEPEKRVRIMEEAARGGANNMDWVYRYDPEVSWNEQAFVQEVDMDLLN